MNDEVRSSEQVICIHAFNTVIGGCMCGDWKGNRLSHAEHITSELATAGFAIIKTVKNHDHVMMTGRDLGID